MASSVSVSLFCNSAVIMSRADSAIRERCWSSRNTRRASTVLDVVYAPDGKLVRNCFEVKLSLLLDNGDNGLLSFPSLLCSDGDDGDEDIDDIDGANCCSNERTISSRTT